MTTTDWLRISVQTLPTGALVPVHGVNERLLNGPCTSFCGDPVVHVVLWNGVYYISDGHHRVARNLRRGEVCTSVRIAIPGVHFAK